MTSKVQFTMDTDRKKEMASLCEELGISMSQALNMFASCFLRTRGFPPAVATVSDDFDDEDFDLFDTSEWLEDAIKDLENGKGEPMPESMKKRLSERRSENSSHLEKESA
jgi:addiction module RelB/DinJ family antitoxin